MDIASSKAPLSIRIAAIKVCTNEMRHVTTLLEEDDIHKEDVWAYTKHFCEVMSRLERLLKSNNPDTWKNQVVWILENCGDSDVLRSACVKGGI